MNESKPNSGWNESKPSFPIAMNVDEAMAIVNSSNLAAEWYDGSLSEAVGVLRAEVERLRAEVQRLDMAGTHSCHDDCQRLPCAQRREIERLRAELAAAKAASVVKSDEVQSAFDNWYSSDDEGEPFVQLGKLFMNDGWQAGVDWLRDRMKERGEG